MARAGKYTLGQWMEVWFENVAQVKVRPSSHATYRGYLDNHIRPNIGDIPLLTEQALRKPSNLLFVRLMPYIEFLHNALYPYINRESVSF